MRSCSPLISAAIACLVLCVAFASAGSITITQNPVVLFRGQTVSVSIGLNPAINGESVVVSVATSDHVIAYPSRTNINIDPVDTTSDDLLAVLKSFDIISPPAGIIGPTNLILTPGDLINYDQLIVPVIVKGYASLVLVSPNDCHAFGGTTTLAVTLDSTTRGDTVFTVTNLNSGSSSNITVPSGSPSWTFPVSNSHLGNVTYRVTSALYSDSQVSFNVLGAISSSLNGATLLANARSTYSVTLSPATTSTVDLYQHVTLESTLPLPADIRFLPGINTVSSTFDPVTPGVFPVKFTTPGFCPYTASVTINNGINCPLGSISTITGSACAVCPTSALGRCSLRGNCRFSDCLTSNAKCQCAAGFTGPACEFASTDSNVRVLSLTPGSTKTTTFTSVDYSLEFEVSYGVLGATEIVPTENLYVAQYKTSPIFTAPTVNEPPFATPTFHGFSLTASCSDGSPSTQAFRTPVEIFYSPKFLTPHQFYLTDLYYWNASTSTWDQSNGCAQYNYKPETDIRVQEATATVCRPGQYQIFIVDAETDKPIPAVGVTGRPVETTTGATGVQPQFPPDPRFTVARPGEPLRLPYDNSAAVFSAPMMLVVFLVQLAAILLML